MSFKLLYFFKAKDAAFLTRVNREEIVGVQVRVNFNIGNSTLYVRLKEGSSD